MPRFLSPEWVDVFNEVTSHVEVPDPAPDAALAVRHGTFAVCQIVTGGPDGDLATTLHVEDGRVTMTPGASGSADVTVSLGWDDAVAMASGTLGAVDALAAGRIRVRGDLGVLMASQELLGTLQRALGGLNATTTY